MSADTFTESDRTALRCAAFASELPMPLCTESGEILGPRLMAFNPWLHNFLFLYNSPFCMGGFPRWTHNQLMQALWILSPGFVPGSRFRFYLFAFRWRNLNKDVAVPALCRWKKAQYIDLPVREVDPNASAADPDDLDPRWLASFVLSCIYDLRMTEQAVLHCPYSRLLQYKSELQEARTDEKKPRFNKKRDRANKARLLARRAMSPHAPS